MAGNGQSIYVPPRVRWHPRVWWSRFRFSWPLVLWLLAIAAATALYYHGGEFGGMAGVVDAVREQVAPLELGRIAAIHADVAQVVKAGDVLVELDPSVLDAELTIERLQAERQFARAVAQAEGDLRDAQLRRAADEGELDVLKAELGRLDDLVERRLVDMQTVTRLRARARALEQAVALYPRMIEDIERSLAEARERAAASDAGMGLDAAGAPAGMPADAQLELETSRRRIGLLTLRRQAHTLRAQCDGVVSEVFHAPGDVVPAGEPVLTLVCRGPLRVIGFLPEVNLQDVKVGMTAYLMRAGGGGPVIRARVTALAPEVMALPNRIRPFPQQTLRGARVVLVPEEASDLVPGEGVIIHLRQPGFAWFRNLLSPARSAPGGEKS